MVAAARTRAVAILTRAPSALGKSRLFAALGQAPDPDLLVALLLDTLDAIPASAQRWIVVTPASACAEIRALAGDDVRVVAQTEGDLGARMGAAMTQMFAAGAAAAALIGSDLPHLPPATIDAAFSRLSSDPESLVLGPAADGGYYLVAATAVPPIFNGPVWGGVDVLADTLRLAAAAAVPVHLLDPLADVDTPQTLELAARTGAAFRTAAWCHRRFGLSRPGNKDGIK